MRTVSGYATSLFINIIGHASYFYYMLVYKTLSIHEGLIID